MYQPTNELEKELLEKGFVPYTRRHRSTVTGFRRAEMPEGYDYLIFWRTMGKTAFCRTRQTVDNDDSRTLTSPLAFADSVAVRFGRDGSYVVIS